MPITVQTQPPTPGANSYVSVADFKAYHDARLNTYTGKTDEQIGANLVKATQYLDVRFRFIGYRYAREQETEWPRQNAYDDRNDRVEGIPSAVVNATCEYALRALMGTDLLADPARDATGRDIKSTSSKVGPIEEEVVYVEQAGYSLPSYPLADRMLSARGLIKGSGTTGLGIMNTARA